MCDCHFCDMHSKVEEIGKLPIPHESKLCIDTLFDEWGMARDSVNYFNAIFDGSWPQSIEILERTLEKVKNIKREEKKGVK